MLKKRKLAAWGAVVCLLMLAMSSVTVFAAGETTEYVPKMYASFWALVPPVVAIVLALITKEVYSSLFIGIVIGGFLAFALSITGGIFFVKLFNLFSKKKINPLIGATGLSAVPMASRVCNEIATKYDPKNHVLNYCMSSNISGVIGSAVAAGVLISFLG